METQKIRRWLMQYLNLGYNHKEVSKTHNLWLWLVGLEWNKQGIMLTVRKPLSILWLHKIEFSFEDKKFYHWQQNT